MLVIVAPPRLDFAPCVLEREEPVLVQALLAQSSIERFNHRVIGRLPGPGEIEFDLVLVGPVVHDPRDEFGAVVRLDRPGPSSFSRQAVLHAHDVLSLQALSNLDRQALSAEIVDDGERAELAPIEERVGHEIDTPDLVQARGRERPLLEAKVL